MQEEQMSDIISSSGIGVDAATLQATLTFLHTHVGTVSLGAREEVLAAMAIVGETVVLDDITNTRRARSGITIEQVMRHAGRTSREQLLEVVSRQAAKWREVPQWLRTKTERVKFCYRVYKKYRAMFQEVSGENALLDKQSQFNLMAIFWILFLFIKNQNAEFENVMQSTSLLHAIVVYVFQEVTAQHPPKHITLAFRRHFSESNLPTGAEMQRLKSLMQERLQAVHSHRYEGSELQVQRLVTESNFAQRYLDDMSNLYDKFKATLPETSIDEISFLELTRNLTPQSIKRNNMTACIQKRIDFTNDDEEDEEDNPFENQPVQEPKIEKKPQFTLHREPLSPFKPISVIRGALTPVSARYQNLGWINGITAKFSREESQQVEGIYERYTGSSYKAYSQGALIKITDAISEFTPECMDFPKRQASIFRFFEHFIKRIADCHEENEMAAIFGEDASFNSILCLTADLFNYAYQSLSGSYRKYCRIFGVSLLQGHKPINWFGKHVPMPRNLENYLYQLQRKILIEEIWEDNEGYKLLSDAEELKKYHNQALLRRLLHHSDERTQELCEKMGVEGREVTRTVNLVRFIIQKRPLLLSNHRIDQIIVCAIASSLSINRSRHALTLEEVFEHYNKLILSYYANRHSLYDQQGNQLNLIDYYNAVFLPSLEDILNTQEHAALLATPIRLQRRRSRDLGIEMTPIPKKFRQAPSLVVPPRRLLPRDSTERNDPVEGNSFGNYRSALALSLRNLDSFPEQMGEDEDFPSPVFGTRVSQNYQRTFSFADLNDKSSSTQ